ncbi:MAG: TrkA family potassium uptake protein [Deltaproteobacteria bacterium]|nr:TrkA family potassium uptake protein [Candidatus Anaeroferrophillacea bacterium]
MKRKFCVIGLGNFGFHIVSTLYQEGHEVTAIDTDREKIQGIKDICTYAILGDAANKDFLDAQGVREMDAVVVSTGDRSHLSTLITLYLKELKVGRILVKAVNEDHGRILDRVGATDVIYPEKDMAIRIARNISSPNILEYIPLAEEYSLSETSAPKHFLGKTLIDLDLRKTYHLSVIAIKDVLTNQFIPAPPPTYRIKDSDVLIMLGKTNDIDKVLAS